VSTASQTGGPLSVAWSALTMLVVVVFVASCLEAVAQQRQAQLEDTKAED
jgi:hypothetical protein